MNNNHYHRYINRLDRANTFPYTYALFFKKKKRNEYINVQLSWWKRGWDEAKGESIKNKHYTYTFYITQKDDIKQLRFFFFLNFDDKINICIDQNKRDTKATNKQKMNQ